MIKKRKFRNRLKKGITVAMGITSILAGFGYTFHTPSAAYTVLFFIGLAWVMLFLQANGGRHER